MLFLLFYKSGMRTSSCGFARFLMTWLVFLPFALYHTFQWFTPAICGLVAFLLIGVEVGLRALSTAP